MQSTILTRKTYGVGMGDGKETKGKDLSIVFSSVLFYSNENPDHRRNDATTVIHLARS
jgi:hypothetical protein